MCGLVGYVLTSDSISLVENKKYVKYFTKALYLDTLRGFDSTGVAKVSESWGVSTHKKALPGYDFLDLNRTKKFIAPRLTVKAMLGHNRAATKGAVNSNNSHPFTHGDITLMHNGTLDTAYGVGTKFDVDSENLCYTMSKTTTVEDTIKLLECLDGAYALVWYDRRDNTVNFARNKKRPLWHMKTDHGWLYASEPWMIHGAVSEQFEVELARPVNTSAAPLPVGKWKKVDLTTGQVSTYDFKPYEYTSTYNYNDYTYGGNDDVSYKEDEFEDLKPGDPVLVEYCSHNKISTFQAGEEKIRITFYGRVVSQCKRALKASKVTLSGFLQEDLDEVLQKGLRVFTAEYGGCYSTAKGVSQVWVRNPKPMYTVFEKNNCKIPEEEDKLFSRLKSGYNVLHLPDQGKKDEDDNKAERNRAASEHSYTFYYHDGTAMTKEAMENEAEKGCAWCSQAIDIDKEDFLWVGKDLMHAECETPYAKEIEGEQ